MVIWNISSNNNNMVNKNGVNDGSKNNVSDNKYDNYSIIVIILVII